MPQIFLRMLQKHPMFNYGWNDKGLIFHLLPDKSIILKSHGKCSKDRFSLALSCNANGSKKWKLLVIGKQKIFECVIKSNENIVCNVQT